MNEWMNLCSASCSAHQSEALPVRDTQREESSIGLIIYSSAKSDALIILILNCMNFNKNFKKIQTICVYDQ